MATIKISPTSLPGTETKKIGIAGTGFISTGFCRSLSKQDNFSLASILTRRPISSFSGSELQELFTQNIDELIDKSDVILECSGDALWASEIIERAFQAKLPVVTMNAEFQIVAGSYFNERGLLTESEGDQPGSLAVLDQEIRSMGFEPLVYGSQKGFLNHDPDLATMRYWSSHSGQRLDKTVSFTDGTKVQIESALVANGLGGNIIKQGLLGPTCRSSEAGAMELATHAEKLKQVISDFVLQDHGHGEVFIVATHSDQTQAALSYYKLGSGPFYYIEKPYHLGHFEIIKSIERALQTKTVLLNNGKEPRISVAAIAKQKLKPGTLLKQGIGSFELRGMAINIKDHPQHIPISLLNNCEIQRAIEPGQMIMRGDIALPDSLASKAWKFTRDLALGLSVVDEVSPKLA